jgi:chain length determinant protein tyrosine kinase EpsG
MLHGPSSRIDAGDTQTDDTLQDGTIGEILRQAKGLANEQVERIVHHQRKHRVRFGEAAIALGMATREDVMRALSQQYRYHYAPNVGDKVERELVVARQPFSDDVESFRDLRSHLMMGVLAADQERRALAVVSADVGDGKTFIAANLAVAFSQLPGGRTLIIDTDMRTPRLHTVFGVDNGAGLSGILAGRAEANVIRPVAELPNLYLMPVGAVPPNPTELLQAPTFAMLMRELVSKFDYVLVDTPAAAHGSDARVIAARCGAALVIGRRNRTRAESLRRLMGHLGKGPAKVAGVVMNDY